MTKQKSTPNTPDDFWSRVDHSGGPDACWPWTGYCNKSGYGRTRYQGALMQAHRLAYLLSIGSIPEGKVVDHVRARGCNRRSCCNPAHLEIVSVRENTLRGDGWTAQRARATHCIHGHPLAGDNLMVRKNGHRYCRTCRDETNSKRQYSPMSSLPPDELERQRAYNRAKAMRHYCKVKALRAEIEGAA